MRFIPIMTNLKFFVFLFNFFINCIFIRSPRLAVNQHQVIDEWLFENSIQATQLRLKVAAACIGLRDHGELHFADKKRAKMETNL